MLICKRLIRSELRPNEAPFVADLSFQGHILAGPMIKTAGAEGKGVALARAEVTAHQGGVNPPGMLSQGAMLLIGLLAATQ